MRPPLAGVRVIEFAGLAPAPFCGMILRDFGADVIRVEKRGGSTGNFLAHGKREVAVDVKHPAGCRVVERLCRHADVIIDPFRPGVLEKLNLGPDRLLALNPRLVYARITGFGQDGPLAQRAGHDINYIALSGVLSRFGQHQRKPEFPVNLLADFAGGGLTCAFGIVAALFEREKSGKGQVIDNSMTEGAAYVGSFLFDTQQHISIWPNLAQRGQNLLDGGIPSYDTYATKDGKYMAVGPLEPKFLMEFHEKLGLEYGALKDQDKIRAAFTAVFKTKTRDEWAEVFKSSDACTWPVLDLWEVGDHPQHRARNSFTKVEQDGLETWMPKPTPRLSRTPAVPFCAPNYTQPPTPEYAQHTTEILQGLGYSVDEIEKLIQDGVVDCATATKSKL